MAEPISQPVFFVVDEDPSAVEALVSDLQRRFHADYRVVGETFAAVALERLDALQDAGDQVALIICAESMHAMPGSELLARSLSTHPNAKRILLIDHGDQRMLEIIARGMALGHVEYYLTKPGHPRHRWCQPWMSVRAGGLGHPASVRLVVTQDPKGLMQRSLPALRATRRAAHDLKVAAASCARRPAVAWPPVDDDRVWLPEMTEAAVLREARNVKRLGCSMDRSPTYERSTWEVSDESSDVAESEPAASRPRGRTASPWWRPKISIPTEFALAWLG